MVIVLSILLTVLSLALTYLRADSAVPCVAALLGVIPFWAFWLATSPGLKRVWTPVYLDSTSPLD